MATNKPQIKAYVDDTIYEKIKQIAEKEHRSISNYIELVITKEIENYEKNNGTIISKSVNIDNGSVNNGNISL